MCVRVCLCVSSEQGSKRSVCQWHREDDKSGWQLLSKALNKDFQKEQPNTEYLTPPYSLSRPEKKNIAIHEQYFFFAFQQVLRHA